MANAATIALIAAKGIDPASGSIVDSENCWTSWEPLELGAESTILPLRKDAELRIWCYAPGFDEKLAHVYTYDEESNWTTFLPDEDTGGWRSFDDGAWTCPRHCFIRISARCTDPGFHPSALGDIADIEAVLPPRPPLSDETFDEIERVAARVEELREPGDLVLITLSDIHHAVGGIWPETARTVQAVARRIRPEAIVQLGDVTDGVAPTRVTASLVHRVLDDLHACGVPVLGCVGNHDVNYFKGNPDRFSPQECAQLYTGRDDLWYYEDFPAQRVRCFFLKSFEPDRTERYGYELAQILWLRKQLHRIPRDWKAIVFSHLTLYAQIHWWSTIILGEQLLARILDRFNRKRRGAMMAFIHGHSHEDQVFRKDSFPCISLGCAKFEDFAEFKPAGSTTPKRALGDRTQELWDVLILKSNENRIELVRFGAGEDRSVTCYDRAR